MIFYHYTSHEALAGILADGLNRGEAPLSESRVINAVNLTTDPDPNGHGLDYGGSIVTIEQELLWASKGIRIPAGTVFIDKRAIRIKLKLPSGDPKLKNWRSWSRKHCEPGWPEQLEAAAGGGRKAKTWYLYFGRIAPDSFLAIDELRPDGRASA